MTHSGWPQPPSTPPSAQQGFPGATQQQPGPFAQQPQQQPPPQQSAPNSGGFGQGSGFGQGQQPGPAGQTPPQQQPPSPQQPGYGFGQPAYGAPPAAPAPGPMPAPSQPGFVAGQAPGGPGFGGAPGASGPMPPQFGLPGMPPAPQRRRRMPAIGWISGGVAIAAVIAIVCILVLPGIVTAINQPEENVDESPVAMFDGALSLGDAHGLNDRPRIAVDRGDNWSVGGAFYEGSMRQEQFIYKPADCVGLVNTSVDVSDVTGFGNDGEATASYLDSIGGSDDAETITLATYGGGSVELSQVRYESGSADYPNSLWAAHAFTDSGTVLEVVTLCANSDDLESASSDFRDRATVAIDVS
ncbi:MAG: hypothetical protein ACTH31_02210 [Pseudoclavibacter sp.]